MIARSAVLAYALAGSGLFVVLLHRSIHGDLVIGHENRLVVACLLAWPVVLLLLLHMWIDNRRDGTGRTG